MIKNSYGTIDNILNWEGLKVRPQDYERMSDFVIYIQQFQPE